MKNPEHIPVLAEEILEFLEEEKIETFVDCTLGLGGHAEKVLRYFPKAKLLGIDQDENNLSVAKKRLSAFKERTIFCKDRFSNLKEVFSKSRLKKPNAVLFDLGLSSPHLDYSGRGFSFKKDEPLDMRFDESKKTKTAADILNHSKEYDLRKMFREFGEIQRGHLLAKKIVEKRSQELFKTTFSLTEILDHVFRYKKGEYAKCFQALRIAVNKELEELEKGLESAFEILAKNGLVIVISYHSLEDRITKRFFRFKAKKCLCSPEEMFCQCNKQSEVEILTKKVIRAKLGEIDLNPRSRSAKLRVARKIIN